MVKPVHRLDRGKHGALGRSVGIVQAEADIGRIDWNKGFAAGDEVLQAAPFVSEGELPAHLCRHQAYGNTVCIDKLRQCPKIQTNIIGNDIQTAAAGQHRIVIQ